MSDENPESLIPAVKQSRGYRSLIAGHQRYNTVGQALNSPDFWNGINRKLGKVWKQHIAPFIRMLFTT